MTPKRQDFSEIPRSPWKFLGALWCRIRTTRKWYLFPVWVLLVFLALVLVLTGHGHILPAIYILF